MSVLFLSGCGGKQEKIRVAMNLSEAEWTVMREKVVPAFEKKTKIAVEAVQVDPSDLSQLLEAMKKAGNMQIDLFAQNDMQLFLLTDKKLVEDLSTYERMIPRQVPKALVSGLRSGDRLYFFPYHPDVKIVYYNKKKFDKYGLKLPRTWNELLAAAKKFKKKEKTGRVLFQAGGGTDTAAELYEWIVSAGGDPFKFNDRGCVRTFTFLQKLWPYLSPDSKQAKFDNTNGYLAGKSSYLAKNWSFGGNMHVKDSSKNEIKTYSGFSGPRRKVFVIGGEVLGIPKGSRNKTQALAFIKHLQSKEIQELLVRELGWPPVRTDAYARIDPRMKIQYNSAMKAMEKGIYIKNVRYWNDFERLINEAFVKIVIKREPVKKTLKLYKRFPVL